MPERFNPEYKQYCNDQLSKCIRIIKGGYPGENDYDKAIVYCLDVRDELRAIGARWQSERLTEWISKAVKAGGFLRYG